MVVNFFIRGSTYRPAFWLLIGLLTFVLAVALLVPRKGHMASREQGAAYVSFEAYDRPKYLG